MTTASASPYAERLQIDPPDLERHIDEGAKLLHLVVVALIEASRPLTLDELVQRLGRAGAGSRTGDLRVSIQRAWAGRPPVVRGHDGRFDLELHSDELQLILTFLKLRRPSPDAELDEPPPPPERGDHEPLTIPEVEVVMGRSALSQLRQVAAILDAADRPMTLDELDAFGRLAARWGWGRLLPETCGGWRTDLVRQDETGRWLIERSSEALVPMRRTVRKLGRPALVAATRQAVWAARREAAEPARRARERAEEARAAGLRRAVLRLVTAPGDLVAAALVDAADRTVRTFMPDDLDALRAALRTFDVLIGIGVRDDLVGLGLDPGAWQLVDVSRPKKTHRGKLKVTDDLLLRSTLEVSRPLGDPTTLRGWLQHGEHAKLSARLATDARHLTQYHAYGALNGFVRLRSRSVDEVLWVSWSLEGDLRAYELLQRAKEEGRTVDVVVGSAPPPWEQPWSGAWRCKVVSIGASVVVLQEALYRITVPRTQLQAIRRVDGPA